MRLLLFDHHSSGGHHLEYLNRLHDELQSYDDITVSVLTTVYDETQEMYFEDELQRLYPSDGQTVNDRKAVVDALEWARNNSYDTIHFLHGDDILPWLAQTLSTGQRELSTVVSFNGNYFGYPSRSVQLLRERCHAALATRGLGQGLSLGYKLGTSVPMFGSLLRERAPDSFDLYSCLQEHLFDHLFVTTDRGRAHVLGLNDAFPVSVAPDPVDTYYDYPERDAARAQLDIESKGPMALFFGQTRSEKGIEFLLNALVDYEGPTFTLVIAGPAADVSAMDIDSYRQDISIPIKTRIEFVDQKDVPLYFRAADGVLVPYLSRFGPARLSGVFHKACGACRPVLASDFGEIGDRVQQYDLGLTFETGSESACRQTLRQWAVNPDSFDSTSMRAYAAENTFGNMTESFVDRYRKVTSG